MPSNILSRILPATDSPSIYETLRDYDRASDSDDIEERAGLSTPPPERPLLPSASAAISPSAQPLRKPRASQSARQSRRRGRTSLRRPEPDEADDDVPASLLIETDDDGKPLPHPLPPRPAANVDPMSPHQLPNLPEETRLQAKWNTTQQQQRLHGSPQENQPPPRLSAFSLNPREKALWRWTNVENLDNFLKDVYDYYVGKGISSITLNRILNLLTFAFVIGFSLFLTSCIDYSRLRNSTKMSDIYIEKCGKQLSGPTNLLLWLCAVFWFFKLYDCIRDLMRLKHLHDFYHYLLEIPDIDIQTVSWQDVVRKLMALRDANPATMNHLSGRHRRFLGTQSKQRMDAHDIANRLMRRENYLIALFNKDILDLKVPLPGLRQHPIYSRTLEWTLSLCILDFIFDDQGQVRSLFMKAAHRRTLSDALRRRFFLIGLINIVVGPFMIAYILALYFFRNFSEYQKDPGSITSRQYTPLAEWKFREFNELYHLFERRINMSYPMASRYVNQFPKDKTVQLAKFVAFVTGALAAVLAVTSLVDPDLFLGFEVTKDKTVLFYLGVFTSIWAVARGMLPEEFTVFDPEFSMKSVINFTHYEPAHWRNRLHSDDVRVEFSQLYKLKVVIFLEEILSMLTTPFILCFSLPDCSERIVDFVREFTVHVDGLGYVCSFAVFDFQRGGDKVKQLNGKGAESRDLRDDYYSTKDGKMLASYYNFVDNYVTNHKPSQQAANYRSYYPQGHAVASAAGQGANPPQDVTDHHPRMSGRQGAVFGRGSQRTPRLASTAEHASPMASVLLDPPHQPSSASLRGTFRPGTQSRLRQLRRAVPDVIEDDETEEMPLKPAHSGHSGNLEEEQSHLGESWKISKAGTVDEAEERARGPAANAETGAGILGLVYQFSKAQTEGRAAGA